MKKLIISAGFVVWLICGSGVNPQVKKAEPKITIQDITDSAHKLEMAVERLDQVIRKQDEK